MAKDGTGSEIPGVPNVLVVEDNAYEAELMAVVLSECGCNVTWAADGESGTDLVLSACMTHPFDIVFLDLNLPRINGVQVLKQLRECTPKTPVVLVTSPIYRELIEEASKLGYFSMIEKPLVKESVMQILDQHRIPRVQ